MIKLTREQRVALKKVFDRGPVKERVEGTNGTRTLSYREFRKRVYPMIAEKCIMVPWCGMVLGIEPDGYTHS